MMLIAENCDIVAYCGSMWRLEEIPAMEGGNEQAPIRMARDSLCGYYTESFTIHVSRQMEMCKSNFSRLSVDRAAALISQALAWYNSLIIGIFNVLFNKFQTTK
jgi:hypothetical protein